MADFCRFVDGFGVLSGEQMVPEEDSKLAENRWFPAGQQPARQSKARRKARKFAISYWFDAFFGTQILQNSRISAA